LKRAKGGEIVFPYQVCGGLTHPYLIQRMVMPGHLALEYRGADPSIQDQVSVTARRGGKPRVKGLVDWPDPIHGDVRRQVHVCTKDPGPHRAFRIRIEVYHLLPGVNSGVRATRADHSHGVIRNERQGVFDFRLDRLDTLALRLPAVVAGTVIFDPSRDSHRELTNRVLVTRSLSGLGTIGETGTSGVEILCCVGGR
jgi:hypothetical protein